MKIQYQNDGCTRALSDFSSEDENSQMIKYLTII